MIDRPTDIATHVNTILPQKSSNLIGYWRMDGDFLDSSGKSNDGTESGGVLFTSDSRLGLNAMAGDGVDDEISIGVSNEFSLTSLTMAAWIKTSHTGSELRMIHRRSANLGFEMAMNSTGTIQFFTGNTGTGFDFMPTSRIVNDGVWHHVLLVFDKTAGLKKYYIDGELDTSFSSSQGPDNNPNDDLILSSTGIASYFNGELDEIVIWNTPLTSVEVRSLYEIQAQSYVALSSSWTPKWESLVGYWKMNGTWQDSSSQGNHGTKNGDATFSTVSKVGSSAGSFDGDNDYIGILDTASLKLSTGATLSAWIQVNTLPSVPARQNNIFDKWVGTGNQRSYEFRVRSDDRVELKFSDDGVNTFAIFSDSVLLANTWYYLVGVFDGATVKLYVNGVLQADTAVVTSIYQGTAPLFIGGGGIAFEFDGYIDDAAIWSTALNESEVKLIYHRQKQKMAGHYDSAVIDLGTGSSWDNLIPRTTLPFFKELTALSETSNSYATLIGSTDSINDDDLMTGLMGLWHLNESSWTGIPGEVKDSSGQNFNGVATGDATTTSEGLLNFSGTFDGNGDYVSFLGSFPNTPIQPKQTISLWAKALGPHTAASGGPMLFGRASDSTNPQFYIMVNTASNTASCGGVFDAGVTNSITGTVLPVGVWFQYVCVAIFDGTSVNHMLYENGQLVGSSSPTNVSAYQHTTTEWRLGAQKSGFSRYFNGLIDEVAIWNRDLTPTEIQQLYRRGANRIKYQVKSCVDASCNCSTYSGAEPDSDDCNGDNIVNNIDPDQTGVAQWLGKNGSGGSFSELENCASIDGSNGECNGEINTVAASFDFSILSNIFPSVSQPSNNRYFQYRTLMEADENLACSGGTAPCVPELISISIGPTGRYYGGSPNINSQTSVPYKKIVSINFSEAGCPLTYQLSSDGTNYRYWSGSSWAMAIGINKTESASNAATSANISTFADQAGIGNLHWRAFLTSDTSQSCELTNVTVVVEN